MKFEIPKSRLETIEKYLTDDNLLEKFRKIKENTSDLKKYESPNKVYELELSETEIETLFDILTDKLMSDGFDEDDEINYTGREIESIIDLFNYYEDQ